MKTKKQSLQKFTEFEDKANELLKQDKITREDIVKCFPMEQVMRFYNETINNKLKTLKGYERDEFIEKIEPAMFQSQKNQLWEHNHADITIAISDLMQEYGRMPHKNELASKTGLSRQTIHKHLKEYATHPQYLCEVEQFRFMTSKVLAKVFKFAVNGDMKAAKLYFDTVGNISKQPSNSTFIQQQNNYIQINKTVLSQESIKHLSSEQLTQIEDIIKTAIPQTEINNIKDLPKAEPMHSEMKNSI